MAVPLERPLVCPVLIGRSAELDILDGALERARDRHGSTVLVSGEAGIGKSRVVEHAAERAIGRGFLHLSGRCFETDRSLPYAPFVDLFRTPLAGDSASSIVSLLAPSAPQLLRLLPELGEMLPDVQATPALDAAHEQRRLIEAIVQVFPRAAAAQPVLIVLEDLHWCDDAGLEVVRHLARRVREQPIVLAATYRTDEEYASLEHVVATLDRQRLATTLTVDNLSAPDIEAMLRAMLVLDRPVRGPFVAAVHELTEGNPFFVEEVVKSLVTDGQIALDEADWDRKPLGSLHVSHSVRDAVGHRTMWLSETARHVLTSAAVVGQRFDFALIRDLLGLGEAQLLESIKELIAAQLVVEASADVFAFRHALTREAIYAQLLVRERRDLHRQVGDAIERLSGPASSARLGELAHHFFEAAEWARVLDCARQMGEQAQSVQAPAAAVHHLTRALQAANELGVDAPPSLHATRGRAYDVLGDFEHALADHEDALKMARAAGDRQAEWSAVLDLGMLWAARDYGHSRAYYEEAHELARDLDDPSALARSLNRLANWYVNAEEPLQAIRLHQQALAIFEETGDLPGVAETVDLLGLVSLTSGDLIGGTAYLERSTALARDLGNRQLLATGLTTLASSGGAFVSDTMVPPARTLRESASAAEAGLIAARDIGWRAGESFALRALAYCLGALGEHGRALEVAQKSLDVAMEIEHRQWMAGAHCTIGYVLVDLLDPMTAREHLEQAVELSRASGSMIWTRLSSALLGVAYQQLGDPRRADDVLDAVSEGERRFASIGQRLVLAARADNALATGRAEEALELVEYLIGSAPHSPEQGEHAIPRLARLRGEALAAVGGSAEADEALGAAQDGAARLGHRSLLWRIYLARGRLALRASRRDDGERLLFAARTAIDEIASNAPDGPLRHAFHERACALLPAIRPMPPSQAAKRAFSGLTAREREVAALVAEGMTSRAIAEHLVVSERTVEGHVGSILAKLGFTSRAQIARWAVERGLVTNERDM